MIAKTFAPENGAKPFAITEMRLTLVRVRVVTRGSGDRVPGIAAGVRGRLRARG